MKRILKLTVVSLVTASLLSGCIGRFALTNKILGWNKHAATERWVNEGIFIAFLFVPVYSLSLLADGVIFNSVEWWTGKNPILAGQTQRIQEADGSVALLTMRVDGAIDVAVTAAGGEHSEFTLVRDGSEVRALDRDGKRLDIVTF